MRYSSSRLRADEGRQIVLLGAGAAAAVGLALYAFGRHRRRTPYGYEEWGTAVVEDGQLPEFERVAFAVSHQGLDPTIRAEVWPFLLDVFSPQSTHKQREQQHVVMVRQYQQLLMQCQALEAALLDHVNSQQSRCNSPTNHSSSSSSPFRSTPSPYQLPDQVVQFSEAHKIIVIDAVRTDFRRHGLGRPEGSSWASSSSSGSSGWGNGSGSGMGLALDAALQPLHMFQNWLIGAGTTQQKLWVSEAAEQVLDASSHLTQDSKRQAARMIAILSAYAVHDPSTGYCQGMSDLLLPFLVLLEEDQDALVFWCFTALMQTMGLRGNFAVDESGIYSHLTTLSNVLSCSDHTLAHRLRTIGAAECYFAYRMIVVLMRRDMLLHQVMTLWDMLFADGWCLRHSKRSSTTTPAALIDGQQEQQQQQSSPGDGIGSQDSSSSSSRSPDSTTTNGISRLAHSPVESPSLFICFVAAVVISQKRRVLEECWDADDVLRLFHSLRNIDLWECIQKAYQLRRNFGKKLV